MKENQLTQSQRKERTRILLLAAAGEVFIKHGFGGASIDLIAETAGYTKGAIYFHFKNKKELLFGVIEYRSELIYQRLEENKEGDDPFAGLLDESTQKKLLGDWFDRDKWMILLLEYLLFMQRNPDSKAEFRKLLKKDRLRLIAIIEEKYKAAGKTPPMPPAEIAQIQEIVDLGFGISRMIDPKIPQSLYEKLLSAGR